MLIRLLLLEVTILLVVFELFGMIARKKVRLLPMETQSIVLSLLPRYQSLWASWWVANIALVTAGVGLGINVPRDTWGALWVCTVGMTLVAQTSVWSGTGIILATIRYTDRGWQRALREWEFCTSHRLVVTLLACVPAAIVWATLLVRAGASTAW